MTIENVNSNYSVCLGIGSYDLTFFSPAISTICCFQDSKISINISEL